MITMKIIPVLCFSLLIPLPGLSMEVFCTKSQCDAMAIPAYETVYVMDGHRVSEAELSSKYFGNVKSAEEGLKVWQRVQKTSDYTALVEAAQNAGEGLQKLLMDYKLESLPAFVCARTTERGLEKGVVYGGRYANAVQQCSAWARGTR